jgi:peptide/nickel transport system permease protein
MSSTTSTLRPGIDEILRQEEVQTRARGNGLLKFLKLMYQNPLGGFGLIVIITLLLVGIFGPGVNVSLPGGTTILHLPRLAPHTEAQLGFATKESPSFAHPFGTDDIGRDMFSRVIYGARISLLVGFISVFLGISIGMVFGMASGYFGGWIDNSMQRAVDAIIAFPPLIALLIIIRILGPNMRNVIIVIALFIIFPTLRIVRGAALSEKNNQYIEAARSIGAPWYRLLFRHLAPNILPLGIVLATSSLAGAILGESALSFLGLGIPSPNPSWGTDISAARNSFPIAIWWPLFPGIAISLTVLGFNLLGDTIRDIADPRLRGSR